MDTACAHPQNVISTEHQGGAKQTKSQDEPRTDRYKWRAENKFDN